MADGPIAPTLTAPVKPPQASSLDASLSPFLTQLMAGVGEQIEVMAAEATAAVVAKEKARILSEFQAHLQDEAAKTLERVIAASKEQLASQALKELSERHETAAQSIQSRWMQEMEQNVTSITAQLQQSMDSSRRETLAQLRTQVTPVLAETQAALQKLADVQDKLRVNLAAMCQQYEDFLQQGFAKSITQMEAKIAEFDKQFEDNVATRVAAAQSTAVALGEQLELLAASAAEQATNALKERTAQISRQSLNQLETSTRKHLESISESIADIAKKTVIRS